MKTCPNCNTSLEDSAQFCHHCGYSFAAQEAAQSADPYDHTDEFDARDISNNKPFAMLMYLSGVLGIIIALLASRESSYLQFHIRQVIKIMVTGILSCLLFIIPFLGWIAGAVMLVILTIVEIICFVRVCQNKSIEPPVVRSIGFLR